MNDSLSVKRPGTIFPLTKAAGPPSLIVLPDLGNSVMYMQKVLAASPTSNAVLGLRLDRDLIGRLETLDIPDIAARFAQDLAIAGLPPPYRLVGHSFAGILAFETAVQLEKRGIPQVELILLDSALPALNVWELRPWQWLASIAYHVKYPAQRLRDRWREYREGTKSQRFLHHRNYLRMDLGSHPPAYQFIIRELYRAMTTYSPGTFAGKLTLFRATKRGLLSRLPLDLGWQRICRQPIGIIDVECDHLSMVRTDAPAREVAAGIAQHCIGDVMSSTATTDVNRLHQR